MFWLKQWGEWLEAIRNKSAIKVGLLQQDRNFICEDLGIKGTDEADVTDGV